MDTSDSRIVFDEQGVCDHCNGFKRDVLPNWHPDEQGKVMFREQVEKIKREGRGKPFDSIIGMSGGLDSSYLLHLAVSEFGLRPLVFHVDGGWNTDIAVNNIQMLVEKLGLDLYTEVINWEEMRDFQLAFSRPVCRTSIFLRITPSWPRSTTSRTSTGSSTSSTAEITPRSACAIHWSGYTTVRIWHNCAISIADLAPARSRLIR